MFRSCMPRAPAVPPVLARRANRIALLLSITATLVAFLVADDIFEHLPHLEDEMAYLDVAGDRIVSDYYDLSVAELLSIIQSNIR